MEQGQVSYSVGKGNIGFSRVGRYCTLGVGSGGGGGGIMWVHLWQLIY